MGGKISFKAGVWTEHSQQAEGQNTTGLCLATFIFRENTVSTDADMSLDYQEITVEQERETQDVPPGVQTL